MQSAHLTSITVPGLGTITYQSRDIKSDPNRAKLDFRLDLEPKADTTPLGEAVNSFNRIATMRLSKAHLTVYVETRKVEASKLSGYLANLVDNMLRAIEREATTSDATSTDRQEAIAQGTTPHQSPPYVNRKVRIFASTRGRRR